MQNPFTRWLGRVIYRLRGWTFEPLPPDWAAKQVVIGFPHRTWFDTVMAFAGFAIIGQRGHVMVKREAFVWPSSILLRAVGAIPVDRAAATGVVEQMAAEFTRREEFQLALVPEGTRRGATRIRTGFWHIAKAARVPIVCWYLDNTNKRTRWVGRIMPSGDLAADLVLIKQLYAQAGLEIPGIEAYKAAVPRSGSAAHSGERRAPQSAQRPRALQPTHTPHPGVNTLHHRVEPS